MRIAIVTLTTTAKRTGVAEYLINLVDGLQQIDRKNEYYIFTGNDNAYMFNLHATNFKEVRLKLTHAMHMRPLFHFWLMFLLPRWVKRHKIDLVHLPNTLPVSGLYPAVTTIHDVVELKTRKYSRIRTALRSLMVKSAIRNSKQIITVSESSARDLRQLGATNPKAIHLGFSNPFENFSASVDQKSVFDKYQVDRPYALFIGTIMRHKNIPILIKAFAAARGAISAKTLVIIGAPDNDYQDVLAAAANSSVAENIKLLNYVSHEEKLILLKNASVFCLISSYEGFGIPILEAQAAGVPVIANNISSLPEVGGEAVRLVDSGELEKQTAAALIALSTDEHLRQSLVDKGFDNIKRFSWRQCATETLETYYANSIK